MTEPLDDEPRVRALRNEWQAILSAVGRPGFDRLNPFAMLNALTWALDVIDDLRHTAEGLRFEVRTLRDALNPRDYGEE